MCSLLRKENLRLVSVNDDTSGFNVRLSEQTGTLTLPIFDDDVADAIEGLTFTVQPGEGYTQILSKLAAPVN